MKKAKWTLGRIIDFEYCLRQDMTISDDNYLKKRDTEIYINQILPSGLTSPSEIFLIWLESIRKTANENPVRINDTHRNFSPGNMYEECLGLLRVIFLIAGFMAGISVCLAFFSYTGHQPLNVSWFLAITLFPQLCLIMVLSGFFLASRSGFMQQKRFVPYPFLGFVIKQSLMMLSRKSLEKISSEKIDAVEATLAIINEGKQVYGLLFFWPLFIIMQLFGIAFNAGILLSTISRILFFDTAFGWQSTLQMSADMVYKVVSMVAIPWRWILPAGTGFPDIDQIIGSRIVLKDGIYHLATNDLVSWWPFMCLTIVFYGLLPRIIMFLSGLVCLEKSLEQQKFDHRECSRLLRRMVMYDAVPDSGKQLPHAPSIEKLSHAPELSHTPEQTPIISDTTAVSDIQAANTHKKPSDTSGHEAADPYKQSSAISDFKDASSSLLGHIPPPIKITPCIALVPEDIYEAMDKEFFMELMKTRHLYDVRKTVVVGIDFEKELEYVQTEYATAVNVKKTKEKPDGFGYDNWSVVMLQEAWQPPIRETLNFIKSLRKVLDKKTRIIVALTGRHVETYKEHAKTEYTETNSTDLNYNTKHGSTSFFTPVDTSDWEIWKTKLSTIADPWLVMEKVIQ
ncbi:MAG: DUF2868 domain-containing protein [Desulfamplus sp.]|nr:DUF2868 domain-containing protein [Desulfamplus sp.]